VSLRGGERGVTVSKLYHSTDYMGLSSDPRPTEEVGYGDSIYEMDTREVYIFTVDGWVSVGQRDSPQSTAGAQNSVRTSDDASRETQAAMLDELSQIRFHLSLMTENTDLTRRL